MAELIPYASRTGTKRNLAGLRDRGWRLLISATGVHRHEGFQHAIDNGAWTTHQLNQDLEPGAEPLLFDGVSFGRVLTKFGDTADWTACPDVVGGGLRSLELSLAWLPVVSNMCQRALIPVQNGGHGERDMQPGDISDLLGPSVGIFVGGSTAWKLSTMAMWGDLARSKGAWCHVGRVNSVRRIRKCALAGATSFDGTSASRYAVEIRKLDDASRQQHLILEHP